LPILPLGLAGLPLALADEDKLHLMFVQPADSVNANGNTLRSVDVDRH